MIQPPIVVLSRLVYVIPDETGKIAQEYLVDGGGREIEHGEALKVLNDVSNKEYVLLNELKTVLSRAHGKPRGWTAEQLMLIIERELK